MPGGIPICVYIPELKLFRVEHSKGKCFGPGGYGVCIAPEEENGVQSNGTETAARPSEFLFLEEALFLYERGLLEVHFENKKCEDSSRLYNMLTESDVSLPVFLVYAHLRAQTFVVVRHTPRRLELLYQVAASSQQEQETNESTWKKQKRAIGNQQARLELRNDARNAPPPTMMTSENDAKIAFDVYQPNSAFRKTNPGPPDFHVAVTSFSTPSLPVTELKHLVESCDGIPLRIATVADSGTVVMFGLTDSGVPAI